MVFCYIKFTASNNEKNIALLDTVNKIDEFEDDSTQTNASSENSEIDSTSDIKQTTEETVESTENKEKREKGLWDRMKNTSIYKKVSAFFSKNKTSKDYNNIGKFIFTFLGGMLFYYVFFGGSPSNNDDRDF